MDAPVSLGTPYTIREGDVFSGSIEAASDRDVVAIEVTAGESYRFDLVSTTGSLAAASPAPAPAIAPCRRRNSR